MEYDIKKRKFLIAGFDSKGNFDLVPLGEDYFGRYKITHVFTPKATIFVGVLSLEKAMEKLDELIYQERKNFN